MSATPTPVAELATAELATTGADRLAADLAVGRTTSVELTRALLDRSSTVDDAGPELRAVLAVSADALVQAGALDAGLGAHGERGQPGRAGRTRAGGRPARADPRPLLDAARERMTA